MKGVPSATDAAHPAVPPYTRAPRPSGRVLIIDDNADLVGALRAVLVTGPASRLHLEVVTASRGDEALAIARTSGFDVAIVDVKLPDTSGVDLIEPLRIASPFSEVVLITGFATMDAAMGALRSGAFAFVPKSFHPEELLATVEQALLKVRLKREREELERRYRALVELTDVLVVGLSADGRVALFNRKASALTGVSSESALGRDFLESWVAPEDRHRMRESVAHVGEGGRSRDIEVGFIDGPKCAPLEAGMPRRIRFHLSSARAEGESLQLVYGIGIDVTERRALEKRAADAEALSAMGALALNLAHEIRNPLNAAVLQLHMLGRDVDKLDVEPEVRGKLHKRAHIVEGEIGRLSRLLTEFLELARPRGIAREPVHIGGLVDAVVDLERDAASARGVRIVRQIGTDGCVAVGDLSKLKQVVLNLVVNSIEAMKEGGTLTATVVPDAEWVRITIGDTGPGIEPEVLANVFDPFFTTKEAGTGLGLSIVRKIVDQHGGDIRIETERGAGTRVHVLIPAGRGHTG